MSPMLDHSDITLLFHNRLSIMQLSFFKYLDRWSYTFSVATTLVLFVLTLMMTFWAPPALTLDMRAFKAMPENEASSLHDFYYFYHLSYYSGNYAMESHDLADTKQFFAAFGNRDISKLMDNTLTQFPQDLKNRLHKSSRSTSLNFAIASSAIASLCIYILVNLATISWCAELCVAIMRRSGTEFKRGSVARIEHLRNGLKEWTAIPMMGIAILCLISMICNFLWERGLYEAFTSAGDTTGIKAHRGRALLALAHVMSYTGGINLTCWGVVMLRARKKKIDLEW
ncbi:hypothetical protein OCU04_004761 [Sclerotinia nivalis]|uniref:Uncharacterized protein n=1 Tax=Sclerotinia nivalis TaxID=352851 RepID=A0A9X0DKZ1_9HELO|nr:hypothetical protein OCU04_004761 [Sclerotinia nivalis]